MKFTILHNFLSPDECQFIIEEIRHREDNYKQGRWITQRYQHAELSPELAIFCYKKLLLFNIDYKCCDTITFSHYYPGQSVEPHLDVAWKQDNLASFYTLLIYLNTVPGGETVFYTSKDLDRHQLTNDDTGDSKELVSPEQGKAVLFDIGTWHRSLSSTEDKYCIGVKLMH